MDTVLNYGLSFICGFRIRNFLNLQLFCNYFILSCMMFEIDVCSMVGHIIVSFLERFANPFRFRNDYLRYFFVTVAQPLFSYGSLPGVV